MMNVFFSIVMVNYNSGEFLEEAIQSVLIQSYNNYELIIVDGGSHDNSLDIIKKYSNRLAWWVSEPDKGQSDAFNKGFSHASGEYFVWLNADDLMLPKTLEIIKSYIGNYPNYKWFAPNTIYIDKESRIWMAYKTPPYGKFVLRHGNIEIGSPSTFFHRSLYEECGPFVEGYHNLMDIDLWLKFINAGFVLKRVSEFGWAFRFHEASKTSSSLKGRPSESFLKERVLVREANNVHPNFWIRAYQKMCRIIYSYPLSLYYTKKMGGKNIYDIEQ